MADIRDSEEWKRAVERAASGPPLTSEQRHDIRRAFGTGDADGDELGDGDQLGDERGDDDKRPADSA